MLFLPKILFLKSLGHYGVVQLLLEGCNTGSWMNLAAVLDHPAEPKWRVQNSSTRGGWYYEEDGEEEDDNIEVFNNVN